MSAIPCASVSLKTMMDGTLRISFDVEPMHAQDAFRLFAAPGTPAALAALQVGYAAKSDDGAQQAPEGGIAPVAEKPKGGALSKLAGMWCNDPAFQEWMRNSGYVAETPEQTAIAVRNVCGIESRAELDYSTFAAEQFNRYIRGPYSKHLIARGITA